MTECVQRHDVAPEATTAEGEALLAEIDQMVKEANRDLYRWLAWVIGPVTAFTAALYLIGLLT